MKVFRVYDSKAEAYLQPFFQKTVGLAMRLFENAATESGHQFSKYAGDYTLFEIGEDDESTGRIKTHDAFINLGSALDAQAAANNGDN